MGMLTRRDREHIEALERQAARSTRHAARAKSLARWARIFPSGISLWFLGVILVILPWAIVYRLDGGWWGLIPSALVALVLLRRGR
jgi:hypothetical protein